MYLPHRLDRIRLIRGLVSAIPLDSREAQRHAARILGAHLDLVECDLHHQLRPHVDRNTISRDLQLQQPGGLPREHFVCHSLEGLTEHHQATRVITSTQMKIAQPPLSPAVPPLSGKHNQIEGVCRFDLEPAAPPMTRLVWSIQRLRHDTLVTPSDRRFEETISLLA